jgi:cytochrome c peroxidase
VLLAAALWALGAAGCGGGSPVQAAGPAALEGGAAAIDGEEDAPPSPDDELRSLAPRSLAGVPVPRPRALSRYVVDEAAAVALGKALFWDVQAGSDGQVACATCHFHAGADGRVAGSRHPGANGVLEAGADGAPPRLSDFPFHRTANPDRDGAPVLFDSDDVMGSQGVVRRRFTGVTPGQAVEQGEGVEGAPGGEARQVTPRNSPSVINAAFNFRNLWDGRASHFFNGVSAAGTAQPDARVWADDGAGLAAEPLLLEGASLASQAVDPPLSAVEMSWQGRPFALLGRKLLALRPLGTQAVHPQDGVLGPLAHPEGRGLSVTYEALVRRAFHPRLWRSGARTPTGHSQLEANFSLFWGLSLQLYQATLVSDDAPFDRYMRGDDAALTEEQKEGLLIFVTHGRCSRCHGGPEFTNASAGGVAGSGEGKAGLVSRMEVAEGTALYDTGFYALGVRPPGEDLGVGARAADGAPLSYAERFAARSPDAQAVDVCWLETEACPLEALAAALTSAQAGGGAEGALPLDGSDLSGARRLPPADGAAPVVAEGPPALARTAVEGAFKTPGLRNVELTGPYMHTGSYATLEQVMKFYTRGGDFPAESRASLGPHMLRINLESGSEQRAIAAFLRGLTDERVRLQQAPFDHPELPLPDGQRVPAVGAGGGAPLRPFHERLSP